MRASPTLLSLAAIAALMAGCSKPASAPDQAASPTEPASAPAAPTPSRTWKRPSQRVLTEWR